MAQPAARSPGTEARERERVQLLFDINQTLLQDAIRLQAEGKACNVQDQSKPAEKNSIEYIE